MSMNHAYLVEVSFDFSLESKSRKLSCLNLKGDIMKLPQLFEGPYHIDSDFRPHVKMDSFPSLAGLKRENQFLGTLTKGEKEYNFWLGNGKHAARGTTEAFRMILKKIGLEITAGMF